MIAVLSKRLVNAASKAYLYWRRFGTRAAFDRFRFEWQRRHGLTLRLATTPAMPAPPPAAMAAAPMPAPHAPAPAPVASVPQWLAARFPSVIPLRTYPLPPQQRRRVTMVTDSIAKGSLFGGVGTALIFCTLLANRLGAELRIVTRSEPPVPRNVDHVLNVYGIELEREMQFVFSPSYDDSRNLDLLPDELFITTSWWTTAATLPSVPLKNIVYLLQEDERMFYPFSDERLRCDSVLCNPDIRSVINTQLLFDHLVSTGLHHLRAQGLHFEPAFPDKVFRRRPRAEGGKRRFVFYARPNNSRNLFFLGIEVIDAAVARGILDPQQWEIVLVGRDIPELSFAAGPQPTRLQNLDWSEYAELIGGSDLGLCLMYTPHPSYPPLDLVASGAVVVTNRYANKTDLSALSPNLLTCDLERESLVQGLQQGAQRALNEPLRTAGLEQTRLNRDWSQALGPVIERLVGGR